MLVCSLDIDRGERDGGTHAHTHTQTEREREREREGEGESMDSYIISIWGIVTSNAVTIAFCDLQVVKQWGMK